MGGVDDVTEQAVWHINGPAVRVVGPGQFVAAMPGDAVITVTLPSAVARVTRPVTVFPGGPPLPTFELAGIVTEPFTELFPPPAARIHPATVTVIGGSLSGRSTVTGDLPNPIPPGCSGIQPGAGSFRLVGLPPGTHRIRVEAAGFSSVEQDVTLDSEWGAAPMPTVILSRRPGG